jgi:hypothetical protein
LSASVQVLPLPTGLYLFSVQAAEPSADSAAGQLSLPAIHISLGPGVRTEHVQFVAGPSTDGSWLFAQGDMLVCKVTGAGATLVLTSIRAPGGQTLSIRVERLENRVDAEMGLRAPPPKADVPAEPDKTPIIAPNLDGSLPLRINAHIRARGDRSFANVPWAGRAGHGLWVESYSVSPLEGLAAKDIEYKGLTSSGFETPWMTDEQMCGTKGMSVPLIGFAVRVKAGAQAGVYDCEYSGYFQSGTVVGPIRNGVPCRSTVAGDPLEGLQIRFVKRNGAGAAAPAPAAKTGPSRLEKASQAVAAARSKLAPAAGKPRRA